MIRSRVWVLVAGILLLATALGSMYGCDVGRGDTDLGLVYDELLGGETTAFSAGRNAFELSARNLTNEERRIFEVGDSFFNQNWVTAPASTEARDGLGPTFNAQSCSSCHSHDGRAKPPDYDDDPVRGLLLRLSVPGDAGPVDEPTYGGQLQDRAILGVPVEGRIAIRYEELPGQYPDGTAYSLRRPTYVIVEPALGRLHPEVMISPRIAPAIIGMGLLEAIPEERILGVGRSLRMLTATASPAASTGCGIFAASRPPWAASAGRRTSLPLSNKVLAPSTATSGLRPASFPRTIALRRKLPASKRPPAVHPRCRTPGWRK